MQAPSMKSIALVIAIISLFGCQQPRSDEGYLGVIKITVTGNEAAVPHFEKGLLLLHSFEYEDAREEFLKAQEADSTMPMAYWGEAMTYNHSLWAEQDYDEARMALARLAGKVDLSSATDLEKDLIQAVGILYRPETPKHERDKAYAEFMRGLYAKYPGNHEVAAFYALSLLGSVAEGRDDVVYGQGAVVASSILEENPKHPGALHYLIHSYDDPDHAQFALDAANEYSKVAPDASHALHMPSHIYVALGMWDEVVKSNEHSYQASVDRMERKKLDNDARGYHSFHWLLYGYLQQGRVDEAREMVLRMEQYAKEKPSKRARVHVVFLKGTYLVETEQWDSPVAAIPVEVADLNIVVRSQHNFLDGMKAYRAGNNGGLGKLIAAVNKDIEFESAVAIEKNSFCMNSTRQEASRMDIEQSRIMEIQLRGLQAWLSRDDGQAEHWLKRAVVLEDSISYDYGPPTIQKPTHELYGDWLLAQGRPEEAMQEFDLALERAPGRILALRGKQKALEASADGNESFAAGVEKTVNN